MKQSIAILIFSLSFFQCVKTPRAELHSPLGLFLANFLGGLGFHTLQTLDVKGFYNPYDKNLYFLGYGHEEATNSDFNQLEFFSWNTQSQQSIPLKPPPKFSSTFNAVGDERFDPGNIYSFVDNSGTSEGYITNVSGPTNPTNPPTFIGPWQSVTNDGRPLIVHFDGTSTSFPAYLNSGPGTAPTWSIFPTGIAATQALLSLYKNFTTGNYEYVLLGCPASGSCNYITSSDGKTWSSIQSPSIGTGNITSLIYYDNNPYLYFVLENDGINTTIHKFYNNITASSAPYSGFVGNAMATNGSTIVIVGNPAGNPPEGSDPVIYYSNNGDETNFIQAPAITTNARWHSPNSWIVYYEPLGKFIISGGRTDSGDRILSSSDGIHWDFN